MDKDDNAPNPGGFVDAVGKALGKLYVLSMYQARATVLLANAVKNEPGISLQTQEKADEALEIIDKIIAQMEEAMDDKNGTVPLREFVVTNNE